MKITHILTGLLGLAFVQGANAADISVYYSPTCPHCHHAREFISSELIYVYDNLKVTQIDVTNPDNQQEFMDTLKKCEYESGGVPVLVIGEKCFQGYADSMQDELRAAVEVDLSDEQKQSAKDNKAAFDGDKDAFVAAHADRTSAIVERDVKKN